MRKNIYFETPINCLNPAHVGFMFWDDMKPLFSPAQHPSWVPSSSSASLQCRQKTCMQDLTLAASMCCLTKNLEQL